MSNGNGHSWSKFSWRDWSADKALHPCSLAAKGFWIELLCIMHEGVPVGHLTMGGHPASLRQMAANAYCSEREAAKYLAELEAAGVFSRTEDGTIYCRRMVKDAAASEAGREHASKRWNGHGPNGSPNGGAKGEANGQPYGNPNAKNLEVRNKKEPPRNPPASGGVARRGHKPARNAFHDLGREFDAELAQSGRTIEGTAEEVADFQAFRRRLAGGGYG